MLPEKHHLTSSRQGFSLLELIIVILIMSLAYMLVFGSMQKAEDKPKTLRIENLKKILSEQGLFYTDSELFCLDKCQKCYLYADGETSDYEGDLALGSLTAYKIEDDDKLHKIDFGRYHDHRVCLRFSLYHNGSSSQIVIQNKTGIYYLPSLFGETLKVTSMEEAEELWLKDTDLLTDNGAFY